MARKVVRLEWIMDLQNHSKGISSWMDNQHYALTPETISNARGTYLPIVKPIIHRYHQCITFCIGSCQQIQRGI